MYTTDLNNKLYMFLKHTISFNTEHNKYIFFDKWANEIDKSYFDEKISEIKQLFHKQLKHGRNNETVLNDLVEMTGNTVNWLSETEIHKVSYIDSLALKNKSMDTIPPEQKIVSEFFIDYTEEEMLEYENRFLALNDDLDYFYTLTRYIKELNNYQKPTDLEKVQLMYCLELYKEAVYEIHGYLYQWQMDLPTTDLSKIDFEIADRVINNLKCNTSLQKIDLAHLFRFLKESKIFFFDENDPYRNARLMNQFIEDNFNYRDKKGEIVEIKNINKQFSIINDRENKKNYVSFLTRLIKNITHYRDNTKV
ncbi:hypothetical protein [Flavobacterium sp. AG291]|uniref:hypothetical protein n=1 Tax=Flavobacterium sp. AG291 TaxID=2184000 RepID=UPI000E0A6B65|nr:hypothetical protein [Flavobacterium sp. AG291]RDI14418.1 hypothetical protein DEU42_102111 [Flavobacterium sp. AG291]